MATFERFIRISSWTQSPQTIIQPLYLFLVWRRAAVWRPLTAFWLGSSTCKWWQVALCKEHYLVSIAFAFALTCPIQQVHSVIKLPLIVTVSMSDEATAKVTLHACHSSTSIFETVNAMQFCTTLTSFHVRIIPCVFALHPVHATAMAVLLTFPFCKRKGRNNA